MTRHNTHQVQKGNLSYQNIIYVFMIIKHTCKRGHLFVQYAGHKILLTKKLHVTPPQNLPLKEVQIFNKA